MAKDRLKILNMNGVTFSEARLELGRVNTVYLEVSGWHKVIHLM